MKNHRPLAVVFFAVASATGLGGQVGGDHVRPFV